MSISCASLEDARNTCRRLASAQHRCSSRNPWPTSYRLRNAELLAKDAEHQPSTVIISCVDQEDAGDAVNLPTVSVVTGRPGLPAQRNAALATLPPGIDIVAFFDDDFVAEAGWLATAVRTFSEEPQVVAFTGRVLADGIKGPGLSFDEAVRIVEAAEEPCTWSRIEPYSPYGCNMAFRLSAVGELKFDERLVLYGWLEDRDFGGALANAEVA